MASSTSIQLDSCMPAENQGSNHKDQAATAESSVVPPNTSMLSTQTQFTAEPPKNQQNQDAIPLVNAQSTEPSPPISPSFCISLQLNHKDPAPRADSSIIVSPNLDSPPQLNPSPPTNHVPPQCIVHVYSSNFPPPNQDYSNNKHEQLNSNVVPKPSEPTPTASSLLIHNQTLQHHQASAASHTTMFTTSNPKKPQKKTVANTAANLANLLPTGTVLVFQALTSSLANTNGKCHEINKYHIGFLIAICAVTCFFSSFTDSFQDGDEKLYYGFATFKGFWVVNVDINKDLKDKLKKHKIKFKDYVHAFGSLIVFLIFAFSSSDVLHCFFPDGGGENEYSMVLYLPVVAGVLSSFIVFHFPNRT
uniref:DUF679 domain-containing protein n=1 Tax=Fagus sylvatica TaxID=28930 RepID=A0A2N9H420_FAGSY